MLAEFAASLGLPAGIAFVSVNGSVEGGTTTFLGCVDDRPIAAFKVARHELAGRRLASEAAILQQLSSAPEAVSGRLPRVLAFRPDLAHGVMAASIVSGKPMPVRIGADHDVDRTAAAVDLSRALDWLADAQMHARSTVAEGRDRTRRRLIDAAAEFVETFPLTARQRERIAEMTARVDDQLVAGAVVEHGDFCRQNILCDPAGNVSGVIDWTFGREAGLPLNDLFYCCILYFLQARRRPGRAGMVAEFDTTILSATATAELVSRLARKHCARLNISAAVLPDSLAWLIVERALFDAALFRECRRRGAIPRWMLAIAAECDAPPDDPAGHQFWFALYDALVEKGAHGLA